MRFLLLVALVGCDDGGTPSPEFESDRGEDASPVDVDAVPTPDALHRRADSETADTGTLDARARPDVADASALPDAFRPADATPGLPDWIALPAGGFEMGGPQEQAQPTRSVQVSAFEIRTTEVTVAEYGECVNAGVCAPPRPDGRPACTWGQGRDRPINCVTWDQAVAYARWRGARLPSEAEWEYAARSAGQTAPYPWRGADSGCDRLVRKFCADAPHDVCSAQNGRSLQGACDLAGNVWEWVQDCWHDDYVGAPVDGSAWGVGCDSEARVHRGGSFFHDPELARVYYRSRNAPDYSSPRVGFRLVR